MLHSPIEGGHILYWFSHPMSASIHLKIMDFDHKALNSYVHPYPPEIL